MRFDYSFIGRMAKGLERDELEALRRRVVRDSHAEAILKEALLDRDYDRAAIGKAVRRAGADFILNSFADARYRDANLLLRSEFLILRHVGSGRLNPAFSKAIVEDTRARMREIRCRTIMYRLCDYNGEELSFLDESASRARGAQRLLEDSSVLEHDFRAIAALLGVGAPVDVLVPFVQFPEQFDELAELLRRRFAGAPSRPRRIGTMLEVPANLQEIERFDAADFFAFGPGDLLSFFYGGVFRNDSLYAQTRVEILEQPLRTALHAIDRMRGRTALLAKSLVGLTSDWDFSAYPTTEIRRLYLPSQIVPVIGKSGLTPDRSTTFQRRL